MKCDVVCVCVVMWTTRHRKVIWARFFVELVGVLLECLVLVR